jgi:hypothetical protein
VIATVSVFLTLFTHLNDNNCVLCTVYVLRLDRYKVFIILYFR